MKLLRTLTLGYAVVLVLALGASLIAIWVYLRRIGDVLGEVRAALVAVRDATGPLGELLQPLQDVVAGSAAALADAQASLARANDRLSALVEGASADQRRR